MLSAFKQGDPTWNQNLDRYHPATERSATDRNQPVFRGGGHARQSWQAICSFGDWL